MWYTNRTQFRFLSKYMIQMQRKRGESKSHRKRKLCQRNNTLSLHYFHVSSTMRWKPELSSGTFYSTPQGRPNIKVIPFNDNIYGLLLMFSTFSTVFPGGYCGRFLQSAVRYCTCPSGELLTLTHNIASASPDL